MRYTNIQYLEKEAVTVSIQNLNASAAIVDGQVVFAISQDLLTTYSTNTTGQIASLNSLGVCVQTAADIFANITNPSALVVGIAKVNPTTANTGNSATAQLNLLGVGEAVCYGFTDAIVQRRTRGGTSASWPSAPAIAAGDQLTPETVNGYLTWASTLTTGLARFAFIAGQSAASESTLTTGATVNTAASSGATVETIRMKVRVTLM